MLDLGAHGDVHVGAKFQFRNEQTLHWSNALRFAPPQSEVIVREFSLDADDADIDRLCASILDELARAADVGAALGA